MSILCNLTCDLNMNVDLAYYPDPNHDHDQLVLTIHSPEADVTIQCWIDNDGELKKQASVNENDDITRDFTNINQVLEILTEDDIRELLAIPFVPNA